MFDLDKFRAMVLMGEPPEPVEDEENRRITDIGRPLRRTQIDEIPFLSSLLIWNMTVVGPRAVWTGEESPLADEPQRWRTRWLVKPGHTGLAQVRGAKSTNPEEKLRLDLEHLNRRSFWFDLKVVLR